MGKEDQKYGLWIQASPFTHGRSPMVKVPGYCAMRKKVMEEEDPISNNTENFSAVVLEETPREEEQHDQNKKVADF